MKTLEEFFDDAAKYAKTTWHGEILPTWITENSEGISIYVTPWASDDEKTLITTMLRLRFKAEGVFRYAMISETWMVTVQKDEPYPYDEVDSLEDHPAREEAVTLIVEDSINQIGGRYMINRDAEGNGTLGDLIINKGEFSGRMSGMVVDAPARH